MEQIKGMEVVSQEIFEDALPRRFESTPCELNETPLPLTLYRVQDTYPPFGARIGTDVYMLTPAWYLDHLPSKYPRPSRVMKTLIEFAARADPWPDDVKEDELNDALNALARALGFSDWIDAYREATEHAMSE